MPTKDAAQQWVRKLSFVAILPPSSATKCIVDDCAGHRLTSGCSWRRAYPYILQYYLLLLLLQPSTSMFVREEAVEAGRPRAVGDGRNVPESHSSRSDPHTHTHTQREESFVRGPPPAIPLLGTYCASSLLLLLGHAQRQRREFGLRRPPRSAKAPTRRYGTRIGMPKTTTTTTPSFNFGAQNRYVPLCRRASHWTKFPADPPSVCSNSRGILRGSAGDPQGIWSSVTLALVLVHPERNVSSAEIWAKRTRGSVG